MRLNSEEHLIRCDRRVLLLFLGTGVVFVLLVIGKLHGSALPVWNLIVSEASAQRSGILVGTPQSIRSDEWLVTTPFQLSQMAHGFPVENPNLGAGKAPLIQGQMPVWHYTSLFRPQLWGFFVLDRARAFSFYWNFITLGLFLSFFLLLLLFTHNHFWLALLGAIWLSLSNFTQWWSGTLYQGLTLSWCMLCISAIYLLFAAKRWLILLNAVFFVIFALNFILAFYPPAQITLGYLGLCLVLGYGIQHGRKHILLAHIVTRSIALAFVLMSLVILVGITYRELQNTVALIASTVYPGKRLVAGGDIGIAQYFAGFYNFFATSETRFPSAIWRNVCEASSFILLFPVVWGALIAERFAVQRSAILTWARTHSSALLLSAYIAFIAIWAFWGLPPVLAKVLLFEYIPPGRTLLASGIANILLTMIFLSHRQSDCQLRSWTWKDVGWIGGLLALFVLHGVYLRGRDPFFTLPKIGLIGTLFTVTSYGLFKQNAHIFGAGILLALLPNLCIQPISFGLNAIFNTPLAGVAQELAHKTPNARWIVFGEETIAQYLKALGMNVFNGVKYPPDLAAMRILDPTSAYHETYNRYAHIVCSPHAPLNDIKFIGRQPDQYILAVHPCSRQLRQLGITYMAFAGAIPTAAESACLHPIAAVNNVVIAEYRASFALTDDAPYQRFRRLADWRDVTSLSPLSAATSYALDTLNGIVLHQSPRPLIFQGVDYITATGWAVDDRTQDCAGGVSLEVDGKSFPAIYGGIRVDVAAALNRSSCMTSGLWQTIPVNEIGKGVHTLSIRILTKDKTAYYPADRPIVFEIR